MENESRLPSNLNIIIFSFDREEMWLDAFLSFMNFLVGYVVPLLGTLYSRTCHEKWIFGWMVVLGGNWTFNLLLDYSLPYHWSQVVQISFNCWFSIAFTQDDVIK